MKIYLSARYELKQEMKDYVDFLEERNHEILGHWIKEEQMDFGDMDSLPMNPAEIYAWQDFFDVKDCDLFISFTEKRDAPRSRGGRHVEFGFAWVMGKPIIIIGPNENVFHAVMSSDIWRMDEWNGDLLLDYIQQADDLLYMTKPRRR